MAVSWACGFEVYAKLATYTAAGWSSSGTVDPRDTFDNRQHPNGVGGGSVCARLDAGATLRYNALSITGGGGCSLSVFPVGAWVSGSYLWAIRDAAGLVVVGLRPSSSGASEKMLVVHNGVNVTATSVVPCDSSHHWWGATWRITGGSITINVWYDGQLVATGTTALTTSSTATQFLLSACASNRVSFDHVVAYSSPDDDVSQATWIQGLRPRSVNSPGSFVPQGGALNVAAALADLNDATYDQTAAASVMSCFMQRRSDIGDAWSEFDVLAVSAWGEGQGDFAQPRGQVYTTVATATDSTGTSVLQSSGMNVSTMLLVEPPGIPASPSIDFAWKAPHIDLLMLSYRTGV
jgi:hypothetical protein